MQHRYTLPIASQCRFLTNMLASFQTTERLFFVMEFVSGGDLFHHIAKVLLSRQSILYCCHFWRFFREGLKSLVQPSTWLSWCWRLSFFTERFLQILLQNSQRTKQLLNQGIYRYQQSCKKHRRIFGHKNIVPKTRKF